jgi:hypothetical protein
MEKLHRSLPFVFIAFFVLVIYSFYQSYFGHIPEFKNVISPIGNVPITITAITHFHAIVVVLWLLMLIIQPILIIKNKVALHRLLGKASYLIVAFMAISLVLIIYQQQIRQKDLPVFAINLFDFPVFIVFYSLAIYYRKNSAYHSRFMVMTIIPLLSPVLARIHVNGLMAQVILWVLLFIIEAFNRKIFKPYLIGLGYYIFNFAVVAYMFFVNKSVLDKLWNMFFA